MVKNKTAEIPIPLKTINKTWIYDAIAVVICLIALYVRVRPISTLITGDIVNFTTNDALYHMRLITALIANFPHAIFYNPMTAYPYGSYIHFGPLFDMMITIAAFVVGFGNPSTKLVAEVAIITPAVFGALTVIPVYFIGRYLGGYKVGLISALLIAFAPGQFMSRSMVGFADHHSAEFFFSSVFLMFFIKAILVAKENGVSFAQTKADRNITREKSTYYSILAGVAYSAYQLCWTGASLFALIVCMYIAVQYIINNFKKESSDYLAFASIPAFATSCILLAPFVHVEMGFSLVFYSMFHVIIPMLAICGVVFLTILEKSIKKYSLHALYFPAFLIIFAAFSLIVLGVISPDLYMTIIGAPAVIFSVNSGGASTIAEASSIFYYGGSFTLKSVAGNFTMFGFLLSILGIIIFTTKIFYKPKEQETLLLVWTIVILLAIYGQNRFAYYYSVNVALISAFICGVVLDKVRWDKIEDSIITNAKAPKAFIKTIKAEQIFAMFIIVVGIMLPTIASGLSYATVAVDPPQPWMESCLWLKDNTPAIGMNMTTIYNAPEQGEPYTYPAEAYGVMSWWDYGHYIEAIGERMPNANPFQAGVGGKSQINGVSKPGASTFFTASSEAEAINILEVIDPAENKSGARYVMSDAKMATDIFMAMASWTLDTDNYFKQYWTGTGYQYLPSERYYDSMEARLHIFDGNGMQHFRLVHESTVYQTTELAYKKIYNMIYGGNIAEVDTGFVKTFEYVKGAKIVGNATAGTKVTISTTIITNTGRQFPYSQSTVANSKGEFNFTVPYSTEPVYTDAVKRGYTYCAVRPVMSYDVNIGGNNTVLPVTEEAVMTGKTVIV